MKNLLQFSILILISITTLFSSTESQAQSRDNNLIVKGTMLSDHTADIAVFEYDSASQSWTKILEKFSKYTYRVKVNPEKNYQVWFTNSEGLIKVLFINKGAAGIWITKVDIDFDNTSQSNGYICQNTEKTQYVLSVVPKEFELGDVTASSKK